MQKELYWLDESWPGKLAVAPRPRGGDWLKDDIASWKRANVNAVLSLLTTDEERDLNLREEAGEVRTQGMEFASLPIPDRQVPRSESKLAKALERVFRSLSAGKNVLVHCRQGNRAQRTGSGLSACEKGNEPWSRHSVGLGGARHICSRNSRTTRLD
jgi:protein tyrosine phosphatase (PTP) superfamily phosphohydrolase (DUF442 family)